MFFVCSKIVVPKFETYISYFGIHVSNFEIHIPNFATKLLPQRKNFYSTVLQQFKHYVSRLFQ